MIAAGWALLVLSVVVCATATLVVHMLGRIADALERPRPRATPPQVAPARSPGYPPPPDSTDAFYVPAGRQE